MQTFIRFALYSLVTALLIADAVHHSTTIVFLTLLSFFSLGIFEYSARSGISEVLNRLRLEIREGKLYHQYSLKEISFYDICDLKKGSK